MTRRHRGCYQLPPHECFFQPIGAAASKSRRRTGHLLGLPYVSSPLLCILFPSIILCDFFIWSSYMTFCYDFPARFLFQYVISQYDFHKWLPYILFLRDILESFSCMIFQYDIHIWLSYMMPLLCDFPVGMTFVYDFSLWYRIHTRMIF